MFPTVHKSLIGQDQGVHTHCASYEIVNQTNSMDLQTMFYAPQTQSEGAGDRTTHDRNL